MSAIGLRVGPFEICDEVVVPGAGAWYRATRTGLTRRQPAEVLVRLLGPAPTTRELAAVQRQFDMLRAVDDPRFPRPVALYEGSGALAVDASPGAPLDRLVEARVLGDVTMTPATLLDLALDLTEALAHAHGRGFHHGHLASGCVTLSAEGQLMVWGLGDTEARPPFSWLPPERARGEASGALTDQWALGAIIVSLVTGRTPWSPGSADVDPRSGVVDDFVDPLARQWPALGRLVRRLMDPNPALRFPSLHPVRLELLALSRRAGGTSDRRALAAWLHKEIRGTDEAQAEPAPAPEIAAAVVPAAPSVPAATPTRAAVATVAAGPADPSEVATDAPAAGRTHGPTLSVRSVKVDPRDRPPEIHSAARADSAEPAASARIRPAARLPTESMAVVHPDEVPDDMPIAAAGRRTSPGVGGGSAHPSASPVRIETDLVEDILPTEMAEAPARSGADADDLPTEMATELLEDDDPMVDVPPIRPVARPVPTARLDASPPVAVRTSVPSDVVRVELTDEELASLPGDSHEEPEPLMRSPEPSYGDEPVPTLPGMEVPEPSAARPVLSVPVELEDDTAVSADDADDVDDFDDLLVEDPLLDGPDAEGEPVFDGRLRVQPASVSASPRAAVPVAVSLESFEDEPDSVEVQIEFDLDDDEIPVAGPRPTVVPFTDPHFVGPDLGLDTPMRPTRAAAPAHARRPEASDSLEPAFLASARWPWERDDRDDPEPPEADFVVQSAPWVATATVAALAVLLMFNVLI